MSKAPGKAFRTGITLADAVKLFASHETARQWFVERRWPDGVACPYCGSLSVQESQHKTMPYLCKESACGKRFSVRTKTVMESSRIGLDKWGMAMFLMTTNLKGVSSMKLHRDLGITQKSAWFMAHRLRIALASDAGPFAGPVEADETFVGGIEANKHANKKLKAGRGTVGKAAVAGVRDRETGKVRAAVVPNTDKATLQGFVQGKVDAAATVYTDDAKAYGGVAKEHATVSHGIGEYVRDNVHTNGIESFWAMFKRGHKGTYHKMSKKHLHRYVTEFVGRHNERPRDTDAQLSHFVHGMDGRRLSYASLIADNGLPSGARRV